VSERIELLTGLGGSTLIRVSDDAGNGARFLAVRTAAGLDALRAALGVAQPADLAAMAARVAALEAALADERRRVDELEGMLAAVDREAGAI